MSLQRGNYFKKVGGAYAAAAKNASHALARAPLIILASLGAFIAQGMAGTLLGPLGIVGGFILGLVQLALLTLYYGWLAAAHRRERLRFADLLEFDGGIFFALINVGFILFIATWLFDAMAAHPDTRWISQFVNFTLVIMLNPIPEIIYIQRSEGMPAIQSSVEFIRDHWLEWFTPWMLLMLPFIRSSVRDFLYFLATNHPFLPQLAILGGARMWAYTLGFTGSMAEYAVIFLAIVVMNWFMLFRAELFEQLSRRRI